jgi:hypothetical protein
MGVGLEENEQVDLELEDIREEAFDASQPKGKSIRSENCTEMEDFHLVRA